MSLPVRIYHWVLTIVLLFFMSLALAPIMSWFELLFTIPTAICCGLMNSYLHNK